jgi:hypothetical protein
MSKLSMEDQLKALQEEIKGLKGSLTAEKEKRTDAEETAKNLSAASQFVGSSDDGYPTGKEVTVSKCKNPWEKDAKKHVFFDIRLPTYMYTINLPAGAGNCLYTNGIEYYHGETYEFDAEILSEMKSRVARCWDHEKSIHGENENAYRRPTNVHYGRRA